MFIKDGIAYAGNQPPQILVSGVRPLPEHKLWLRFNTGEVKIFDFAPLLTAPAFAALQDEEIFKAVYIDYGIPVWCDGAIDIAPEKLYAEGISMDNDMAAV